eukprot:8162212-Pyramimonas_sp.AAC.1
MDPLIRHLATFVEHHDGTPNLDAGYLGACADDIGLLTYSCAALRRASEPFAAAEELALLSLKPRKCFIVPLWAAATPDTINQTKTLLAELGPPWGGFSVAGCAKYFG